MGEIVVYAVYSIVIIAEDTDGYISFLLAEVVELSVLELLVAVGNGFGYLKLSLAIGPFAVIRDGADVLTE